MSEPNYTPPDTTLVGESHIEAYRESNGDVGYIWNGVPTLLLTTTGRKSGEPRTSALIFGRDGDDYLLIASYGGAPSHPLWYLNLEANPEATIQVKDQHIRVRARTATAEEKPRLWGIMRDQWPNYDVYTTRTERVIPLVVLSPVSS